MFSNGSYNNKTTDLRVGHRVYFGPNNLLNAYIRMYRDQSVNNAELQVVEHILTVFPLNKNLTILADSAFTVDSIKNFRLTNSNKHKKKMFYRDTFVRILKLIDLCNEKYQTSTNIVKVYSHTKDRLKPNLSKDRKELLE